MILTILLLLFPCIFAEWTDMEHATDLMKRYTDGLRTRDEEMLKGALSSTYESFNCEEKYPVGATRDQILEEIQKLPGKRINVHPFTIDITDRRSDILHITGKVQNIEVKIVAQLYYGKFAIRKEINKRCVKDQMKSIMIDYNKHALEISEKILLRFYGSVRLRVEIMTMRAVNQTYIVRWHNTKDAFYKEQIIGRKQLLTFPLLDLKHRHFKVYVTKAVMLPDLKVVCFASGNGGAVNSSYEMDRTSADDIHYRIVAERRFNLYQKEPGMDYENIKYAAVDESTDNLTFFSKSE